MRKYPIVINPFVYIRFSGYIIILVTARNCVADANNVADSPLQDPTTFGTIVKTFLDKGK